MHRGSAVRRRGTQKNFTDAESRIMKSKDGFVQAYNAQAAVDAHAQIIVAQSGVDCGQLVPMIDAVEANLGRMPEQASADSGYCSQSNLEALESRHIDGVATGRAKDAVAGAAKGEVSAEATDASAATDSLQPTKAPTHVEAMRAKIKAGGHNSPYRLRKQLPEPVFGQIKQARGFRQFLMRGFEKVRGEWAIVCTAHNLLKLAPGEESVCGQADDPASKASGCLRPPHATSIPSLGRNSFEEHYHQTKVDRLLLHRFRETDHLYRIHAAFGTLYADL
jgi:Transposase DDE domain